MQRERERDRWCMACHLKEEELRRAGGLPSDWLKRGDSRAWACCVNQGNLLIYVSEFGDVTSCQSLVPCSVKGLMVD